MDPAALIGTWQLVSRADRDGRTGEPIPEPSLGPDPTGFLVYDAAGRVHAQIMSRRRPDDPGRVTAPAVANNVAHVGGYYAYFGRYEVDAARGRVLHHIEGSLLRADVGRTIWRRYRLLGPDTIALDFEPGGESEPRIVRSLVWKRIAR
jgi:hypothetical protein